MAIANMLTVVSRNDVTYALKNPSKYELTYADLDSDNSFTGELGYLNRDMVRANHTTIDVSWDKISFDDAQNILKAVSDIGKKNKAFFYLKYYDYYAKAFINAKAVDDNGKVRRFYATDRKTGTIKIKSTTNGLCSLSFSIIEF